MYADVASNFPLLSTKKIPFKSVLSELLWFLSGSTNDYDLRALNGTKRTIWTDNLEADYWKTQGEFGDLGMIYGKQWRNWNGVDQIKMVEDQLKTDPYSRRILLQSYSPEQIGNASLPACHLLAQFYVHAQDHSLSCHVYIRSNDMFLGHPFNIASYATLMHMLASAHGFIPGDLIVSMGDAHIYMNHYEQVETQLSRGGQKESPILVVNPARKSVLDFVMDDFNLLNYDPDPAIKAPMAV
tara:strand:- start:75454 stop:76176 length:723 start_codon:yes stop_codon:yes gene_type:complete